MATFPAQKGYRVDRLEQMALAHGSLLHRRLRLEGRRVWRRDARLLSESSTLQRGVSRARTAAPALRLTREVVAAARAAPGQSLSGRRHDRNRFRAGASASSRSARTSGSTGFCLLTCRAVSSGPFAAPHRYHTTRDRVVDRSRCEPRSRPLLKCRSRGSSPGPFIFVGTVPDERRTLGWPRSGTDARSCRRIRWAGRDCGPTRSGRIAEAVLAALK